MPFFKKSSRASADKAAGPKTKKQKDSKKKKGRFLRTKKKTPLIHCEDASRASSTQPQPRWSKIETDFTGIANTSLTENNKTTLGIIVDSQIENEKVEASAKAWVPLENTTQFLTHGDDENRAFSAMQSIQEGDELNFAKLNHTPNEQDNEPSGPIDTDEYVERMMSVQTSFPEDYVQKHVARSSEDIKKHDPNSTTSHKDDFKISVQTSFPDQEQKYTPRSSEHADNHSSDSTTSNKDDCTPPHGDDVTLTYSQSAASVGDDESVQQKAQVAAEVDDEPKALQEEEGSEDEEEKLADSDPTMSAYVSLHRVQKSDLTENSTASSLKPSRSDEGSQPSDWKPKSNMTDPLGATPQEIDALNRFLSVVGPNFNGRNLSFGNRKDIYDGARKVGLNKVLVDKFLDQSAGIATVDIEEASSYNDISPCSTYSSTYSRSIKWAKSEYSDQTSATGYSRYSDNTRDSDNSGSIHYKYLPRTGDSPHANQNAGCKGIFGEFFWHDSKKATKDIFRKGQDILESIGVVVAGEEDESVHGEP
ncbi:MAG: hypothetical protein SGBAC_005654 [Bacillariaceae sp.]